MKLSHLLDDAEYTAKAWRHYAEIIRLIDAECAEPKIFFGDLELRECGEEDRGEDTDKTRNGIVRLAREFALDKLRECKEEFENMGVDFDWHAHLPEDLILEWFGEEALAAERQRRRHRQEL